MRAFLGVWFDLVFDERENVEPRIFGWLFVAGNKHTCLRRFLSLHRRAYGYQLPSHPLLNASTSWAIGHRRSIEQLSSVHVSATGLERFVSVDGSHRKTFHDPARVLPSSHRQNITYSPRKIPPRTGGALVGVSFTCLPARCVFRSLGGALAYVLLAEFVTKWVVAFPSGVLTAHIALIISSWIAYHTLWCACVVSGLLVVRVIHQQPERPCNS